MKNAVTYTEKQCYELWRDLSVYHGRDSKAYDTRCLLKF